MRAAFIFWVLPVGFLALWYGLSANDYNMGTLVFSRAMHDHVMGLYASTLGMERDALPPLLARALVVDSLFVAAIVAFRKRKVLVPWVKAKFQPLRDKMSGQVA